MGLKNALCVLWGEQKGRVLGDGLEPGSPVALGSVRA